MKVWYNLTAETTGRNSTVELIGTGVDMAERYRKGRSKRRTSRSTPDEENPWYQEKKKHESEVDERAKQISTSMAKLAFENLNTVVFSLPLTDGKMRKIVESIEAEIRRTGINYLKLEGEWDVNEIDDKNRYVLEKTYYDFEKTEVYDDSWNNQMRLGQPFIFCSIFEEDDDDGPLINKRWKNQNLTLYSLTDEGKWKKGSGCFDTSVQIRLEDQKLKSIELQKTQLCDDEGGSYYYHLYPLVLLSVTQPLTSSPQAIFIVDVHRNFEYFNQLQPKPGSVIEEWYHGNHGVSYNFEDYEDILED